MRITPVICVETSFCEGDEIVRPRVVYEQLAPANNGEFSNHRLCRSRGLQRTCRHRPFTCSGKDSEPPGCVNRSRSVDFLLLVAMAHFERRRLVSLLLVELEARADNEVAIQLYEKRGFRHEARKRNAMRFDGRYHDSVQMGLIYE